MDKFNKNEESLYVNLHHTTGTPHTTEAKALTQLGLDAFTFTLYHFTLYKTLECLIDYVSVTGITSEQLFDPDGNKHCELLTRIVGAILDKSYITLASICDEMDDNIKIANNRNIKPRTVQRIHGMSRYDALCHKSERGMNNGKTE